MASKHPDYPNLDVLMGAAGELPRAGAFYAVKKDDTLIKIAKHAYGVGNLAIAMRINKSEWNKTHCIYREDSLKCTSKKVDPSKGWLALCPPYPIIWIPSDQYPEPTLLPDVPGLPDLPAPEPDPDPANKGSYLSRKTKSASTSRLTPSGGAGGAGGTGGKAGAGSTVTAGMGGAGWLLGLLLLAAGGYGVWRYMKSRKGKGKAKGKAPKKSVRSSKSRKSR